LTIDLEGKAHKVTHPHLTLTCTYQQDIMSLLTYLLLHKHFLVDKGSKSMFLMSVHNSLASKRKLEWYPATERMSQEV
jgi:hypothetical protein